MVRTLLKRSLWFCIKCWHVWLNGQNDHIAQHSNLISALDIFCGLISLAIKKKNSCKNPLQGCIIYSYEGPLSKAYFLAYEKQNCSRALFQLWCAGIVFLCINNGYNQRTWTYSKLNKNLEITEVMCRICVVHALCITCGTTRYQLCVFLFRQDLNITYITPIKLGRADEADASFVSYR